MNILVTGGSGFIGTNLVTDLRKQGHTVTIYDKQISETYPDRCIIGDIRDKENLTGSMRGVDAVYHLTAEHRDDVHPALLYYEVNVGGAENMVYALKENNVKRLIFTSTVAVYGLNPNVAKVEGLQSQGAKGEEPCCLCNVRVNSGAPDEDSLIRPFNDYGKSKYKAETIFSKWADSDPANCLITVRPTVIFGEKNRGNVYNLLNQIASNRFVMVGNGKNRKSMGYVLNCSKFLTFLLKTAPGKYVYNYADKPDLTVDELVSITRNVLGKKNDQSFRLPYMIGLLGGYGFDLLFKVTGKTYPISSIRIKKFSADTVINTDKLQKTGFIPSYTLAEGLTRMIKSEFL